MDCAIPMPHRENEDRVKEEKAAQLLFGIDEGMAHGRRGA